jgi:hypothetical protein
MKTTRKASNWKYFYKNFFLKKVPFQSIFCSENVFSDVISLNRVIYINFRAWKRLERLQIENFFTKILFSKKFISNRYFALKMCFPMLSHGIESYTSILEHENDKKGFKLKIFLQKFCSQKSSFQIDILLWKCVFRCYLME